MARQKLSGADLARRLKVSAAWISYRINDQREIGLNDLEDIATALGVPVMKLLSAPLADLALAA